MKYINIPVYLNRVILGITGILYLTIILGLYAQIVLGGFQLLSGLILLICWRKLAREDRKTLLIYWSLVLLYGFFWSIGAFDKLKNFGVLIYIFIPLGIAAYFTFFLESLKIRKS